MKRVSLGFHFVFVALLSSGLATTLNAVPISYTLTTQSAGAATVSGSFTTDGTLGLLAPSNVTSASITISDGSDVFILGLPTFASNFVNVFATASSIDITPVTGALDWCSNAACRAAFRIDETQTVYIYGLGQAPIGVGPAKTPFATANVPEASSMLLLVTGLAGLFLQRRVWLNRDRM